MRNATTFARLVLGGYLAVHGSQKLFGAFGGHGLDATAQGFERLGLTPGREMAILAGASELGGGLLTATGIAEPLGPISLIGTMAVATVVHRESGPLSAKGGYELALTNLALAAVLAAVGPAGRRLGPSLPPKVTAGLGTGAAVLTGLSIAKLVLAARAASQSQPTPGSTAADRNPAPERTAS